MNPRRWTSAPLPESDATRPASVQARRLRLHPLVRVGLGERHGRARQRPGWRCPNRVEPRARSDSVAEGPARSIFDRFARRRPVALRVFRRDDTRDDAFALVGCHSAWVRFVRPCLRSKARTRAQRTRRAPGVGGANFFSSRGLWFGDVPRRPPDKAFRDHRGGFRVFREPPAPARRGDALVSRESEQRGRDDVRGERCVLRRPRDAGVGPPRASGTAKSPRRFTNSRDVVSNLASARSGRAVGTSPPSGHASPQRIASSTSGRFARVSSRETVPSERRAPFASASLFTKSRHQQRAGPSWTRSTTTGQTRTRRPPPCRSRCRLRRRARHARGRDTPTRDATRDPSRLFGKRFGAFEAARLRCLDSPRLPRTPRRRRPSESPPRRADGVRDRAERAASPPTRPSARSHRRRRVRRMTGSTGSTVTVRLEKRVRFRRRFAFGSAFGSFRSGLSLPLREGGLREKRSRAATSPPPPASRPSVCSASPARSAASYGAPGHVVAHTSRGDKGVKGKAHRLDGRTVVRVGTTGRETDSKSSRGEVARLARRCSSHASSFSCDAVWLRADRQAPAAYRV